MFYDRLLASYAAHPSTVVLSTHLIDEAADLLERVVMIDHGRIVLDAAADDVRGSATTVSGPIASVEEFAAGRRTWDRRRIASQASVVVAGTLNDCDWSRARKLHLSLESLSMQQVMIHAAGYASEEPHEKSNA
jgi:ABC-2 type transport system ATP-binding protein